MLECIRVIMLRKDLIRLSCGRSRAPPLQGLLESANLHMWSPFRSAKVNCDYVAWLALKAFVACCTAPYTSQGFGGGEEDS